MNISNKEFDRIVKETIGRIPEEIRRYLDNILITVKKKPTPEMLDEAGLSPDETLLGLYRGVPLGERSIINPPLHPDTIFIFKKPVEEMCSNLEELENEIEITVVHEIAHFVGFSEERLSELGYS